MPHAWDWPNKFRKFDHMVFYSKFGYKAAMDATPGLSASMIYHGVDPYFFRPLPKPYMDHWKKQMGQPGISFENKFIVGMVARNQSRKSHPQLLKGFAKFAKDKTDVMLLMNCVAVDQGWNIDDLINRYELRGKAFITGSSNPAFGMPMDKLMMLYNAMDVHLLATEGEGFGIPILESMSCGVPNMTNAYAAGEELVRDSGGILLEKGPIVMRGSDHNFERQYTDPDEVAEKLQWLYEHPVERKEMGRKARAYALTMSWDRMNAQWDQVLTNVLEDRDADRKLSVEAL